MIIIRPTPLFASRRAFLGYKLTEMSERFRMELTEMSEF